MFRAFHAFIFYILWHYTRGFKDYVRFSLTFLWFVYNFFSIPVLFATLFAPWKRMGESYRGGFDLENFFAALIVNVLMRIVGFCVRSVVIILGLAALLITVSVAFVGFFVWLALPLLLPLLFLWGIVLIVSSSALHL